MTKKLDMKVNNSMKKVINCKWEKVNSLKEMLNFYDNLKNVLDGLDEGSIDQSSGLQKYQKDFENKESIDDLIQLSTNAKLAVRQLSAKKGNNLAIKLYLEALSYREQCKILLVATTSLEKVLENLDKKNIEDIKHYFYYEGVDKVKIFKIVFAVFKVVLSLLPVIGQGIATFSESVADLVGDIKDVIDDVIDIKENVENVKETIEE